MPPNQVYSARPAAIAAAPTIHPATSTAAAAPAEPDGAAAAPVEEAPAEGEAEPEAEAEESPLSVPLALAGPSLAETWMPVLFVQWEEVSTAWSVKVMSAHCV